MDREWPVARPAQPGVTTGLAALRLDRRFVAWALAWALASLVAFGLVAAIIPNPVFGRQIPPEPFAIAVWLVSAPLLGLVGTIAGMMTVFGDVGQPGLNDAAKLAAGIALILRATLIGLLIAIPSLIAWSYFSKKVEVLAVEMEALCDDFIRRQYAGKK